MRYGADLIGEDDHGVLAGLGLEDVPDKLGDGRLVANKPQLCLPWLAGQVAPAT